MTEKNLLLFMSTAIILKKLSGVKWSKIPKYSIEVGRGEKHDRHI